MGDVRKIFLMPLLHVFSPQRTDDVESWMAIYETALATFDDGILADAAKAIISTRQTRTFPLPADCSIACKEAISERAMRARSHNIKEIRNAKLEDRHPECADRARIEADRLFASSRYSRDAIREGWSWTLHDWFRRHQRQPDKYEAEKIRITGMKNNADFWAMVDPENGINNSCAPLLIRWRENVTNRLSNLIEVV